MQTLILQPGFDLSREQVTDILQASRQEDEPLEIEIPVAGRLYFTDSHTLAYRFLLASYIGEKLAEASTESDCSLGDIDEEENVVLFLTITDEGLFIDRLWETIPVFSDEEEEGIAEAEEMLDIPVELLKFPEIVERARDLLAFGDDESDD